MNELVRVFKTISFIAGLCSGLVLPVLFIYLRSRGVSNLELAILALASTVTTIALELPSGNFADAFGRKRTFQFGQVVFVLFCVSITFSKDFVGLVISMALAGLSTALVSGTLDSIFVERCNQSGQQASLQMQLASQSIFALLGTVVGVAIGVVLGLLVGAADGGIFLVAQDHIFLIVGIVTVGLMVYVHFRVEEIQPETSKTAATGRLARLRSTFKRSLGAFSASRQLVAITSSSAIAAAGYMSFEKFWQLQVNDLAHEPISRTVFYWFFFGGLVVSIAGQQLSVKLCNYFKENLVYPVIAARLVLILAFICLYLSHDVTTFACSYALVFLSTSSSSSPSMALFHKFVPDDVRTSLLSIRSMSVQAGATLGIIQAGLIAQYFSIETAFLASACLYVISTLVFCLTLGTAQGQRVQG